MKLNIIKNYLTNNRCYKKNEKRKPIGIQLHTIGTGQGTAQAVADYWNQAAVAACVTYIVDCEKEGKVLQCLSEDVRSWADAGYGNNNLITFEICESDYIKYEGGAEYKILNEQRFKEDILRGYNTAVLLCADICKRYGWNPTDKLASGLYLISSHDEGRRAGLSSAHVDPTHIWSRFGLSMDGFRQAVNAALAGDFDIAYPDPGTQTVEFANLSEPEAAAKLLEISRPIAEKYSLFPSVCAAQTILESGYGYGTELARIANNVCGMKAILSGNTWPCSVWDGSSTVRIKTPEQDAAGNSYYIYADFRKYPNIETSIEDRCAYLLGAQNGSKLRYDGIQDCKNYQEQIKLIKAGGYATDTKYVDKICNIIQRFDLARYDKLMGDILPDTGQPWLRVRKTWADAKSQIGAFHDLSKAKAVADKNPWYYVFDENGKAIYPEKKTNQQIIDAACTWAVDIANDNSHGYNNKGQGWGPEYNCIGLVMQAYNQAGLNVGKCSIDKMAGRLLAKGFQDCTGSVNFKTGAGLQKGDVLLMLDATGKHGHTELCIGSGKVVGARNDDDGCPGDCTGHEIAVSAYFNYNWQRVFRLPGSTGSGGKKYRVQVGAYGQKKLANQQIARLKNKGFDACLKLEGKWNIAQAGIFDSKENAERLKRQLKTKGFEVLIKEI